MDQEIIIYLPENLSDYPVKVLKSSSSEQILISCKRLESDNYNPRKDYALIPCQCGYKKLTLDDIAWIEASGSYSIIHFRDKKTELVSVNLSFLQERLPSCNFVRIHRSHIVNLKYVTGMNGSCLIVGDKLFSIGRSYQDSVNDHFIFLSIRRKKSK